MDGTLHMQYAELQHFLLQDGDRIRLDKIVRKLKGTERAFAKYFMLLTKLRVSGFSKLTKNVYRRLIDDRFRTLSLSDFNRRKVQRLIKRTFTYYFPRRASP